MQITKKHVRMQIYSYVRVCLCVHEEKSYSELSELINTLCVREGYLKTGGNFVPHTNT